MAKKSKPPARKSKFHSLAYTLEICRELGWEAGKTEYRQPFGKGGFGLTKDLFGFVDVLAIADEQIMALQVTSEACIMRRVHKIIDECGQAAERFLMAGGVIEVWGYRREMVGKSVRWNARRKAIRLSPEFPHLESHDILDLKGLRLIHANRKKTQDPENLQEKLVSA